MLGFGLVAVDGESLDRGIFDVPAADHGKSQATNGLARYEIIEVKRRGDLEGPLVDPSGQGSRGHFESALVVIVVDGDAIADLKTQWILKSDLSLSAIAVGGQRCLQSRAGSQDRFAWLAGNMNVVAQDQSVAHL